MGVGIKGQISKRPVITKGGQTFLISDVHCIRLREYSHRHTFHVKHTGWNLWGNIEVNEIMEVMKLMVEGEGGAREIYYINHRWELPDNYPVFTVVMVIYHYIERIWRILVKPNFCITYTFMEKYYPGEPVNIHIQ